MFKKRLQSEAKATTSEGETSKSEKGHCENRTRDLSHPKRESYH